MNSGHEPVISKKRENRVPTLLGANSVGKAEGHVQKTGRDQKGGSLDGSECGTIVHGGRAGS